VTTATVAAAYRDCERTTRLEAANFFYGIRLLPLEKRRAMSAVYALARRVDDVGDGALPEQEKLDLLAAERAGLAHLHQHGSAPADDRTLVAVADARDRFDLPLEAFERLIDGVELDVRGARFATWEELVHYCGCVAGSIGRLCVAIFGASDPGSAGVHADELGVAMQLTNILRDVRGDFEIGRVYLPADELAAHGITEHDLADGRAAPRWNDFVDFQARRARRLFASGLRVERHIPQRAGICVRTMAGLYQEILAEIEQQPALPLQQRVSLPPSRKAAVLLRAALPRGARRPAPESNGRARS
jgi:15-cis-phytoene synthase